ncbi:hypothetical protein EUTSA_v10023169mg [Eutrema salsugineum]|uniref:Uncharacterized protein n=1 Tax=Eutrema salsugineum TaxID=72664 RepID=V4M6U1_EUTSA|nr:hypothetical protein EUTSA_v10023169mg [Eutrema salsugineum]
MNHLRVFLLIFFLVFGLYEAKHPNRIVVNNQFGSDKEYYFDNLEVYRNGIIIRSGQLRQWTARLDGIYFTRDYSKPVGHVLDWKSTKI